MTAFKLTGMSDLTLPTALLVLGERGSTLQ